MQPYKDIQKEDSIKIRTFQSNVTNDELVWHRDLKDRTVEVIKSNGWMYQMDNELPKPLIEGNTIFIPKMTWHRVKKGKGPLTIKIIES